MKFRTVPGHATRCLAGLLVFLAALAAGCGGKDTPGNLMTPVASAVVPPTLLSCSAGRVTKLILVLSNRAGLAPATGGLGAAIAGATEVWVDVFIVNGNGPWLPIGPGTYPVVAPTAPEGALMNYSILSSTCGVAGWAQALPGSGMVTIDSIDATGARGTIEVQFGTTPFHASFQAAMSTNAAPPNCGTMQYDTYYTSPLSCGR